MSGRSIVITLSASIVAVVIGAVFASATIVVAGMASAFVSGFLLVIRTDDTTQPMSALLFAEESSN